MTIPLPRPPYYVQSENALAWQPLRRYSERQGDLAQFRLNDAGVLGSHTQQLLLRRQHSLDARIHKGIAEAAARLQVNRVLSDWRLEQHHDRTFERPVERCVGLSELAIRFYDAWLERGVQRRAASCIDRRGGLREWCYRL